MARRRLTIRSRRTSLTGRRLNSNVRQLEMSHTVVLTYNAAIIRDAVFCFWHRTVGWGFIIALIGMVISLVVLLLSGDRSWLVGVNASALIIGIGFAVTLYLVHYRSSMAKFQGLSSGQATLAVTDGTLSLSSELGSSTLPWSAVKEVWQFEGVWLLLFSKAQFVTLPVPALSAEVQSFVLQKVRAAGGKVA